MKRILTVLLVGAAIAGPAFAQPYPTARPITFVVPFPPGSPTDVAARIAATIVGDALKQTVVVDYRTGASGAIASRYVARSAPDGYTLLATSSSTVVAAPALNKNLPYDSEKDFTPISPVAKSDIVVVGSPKLDVRGFRALIDYAKQSPGKVSFGSSGEGSILHLSGELFASAINASMVHVPYRGAAPATVDLLGGQVDLMFDTVSNAAANINAGRLQGFAVLSPQRSAVLAQVPTSAELGHPEIRVPAVWLGLMGPAHMPPAVVEQLVTALQQGVKRKDIQERLALSGMQADTMGSEEFGRRNQEERRLFDDLVRKVGIKPSAQ